MNMIFRLSIAVIGILMMIIVLVGCHGGHH